MAEYLNECVKCAFGCTKDEEEPCRECLRIEKITGKPFTKFAKKSKR